MKSGKAAFNSYCLSSLILRVRSSLHVTILSNQEDGESEEQFCNRRSVLTLRRGVCVGGNLNNRFHLLFDSLIASPRQRSKACLGTDASWGAQGV